ncbi:MAG: YezD family protein [Ruminococcus sp.]|nr:YezD family protein [Ruminococcus sp.]
MKDITPKQNDPPLERILQLMENIQFGSITLIIQDGKIIQIEKTEKYRIKEN